MRRPTRYSLLLMAGLIVALAGALWLRAHAPPEAARLLPECDAIVYANFGPLRAATHYEKTPVARSPDFQRFIDATGIVPERDLEVVAFALHRMDDPHGPNGPVAYSEVFEGRFDGSRLARYLQGIASSKESYAGHEIYTIPVGAGAAGEGLATPGRNLRVTQLGYDTIAASNMPTTEQIHAMLDRHRAGASPFAGSSLLAARYGDVPVLSTAWGIGHIGLPFSESGAITLFGLQLPLAEDTTFVASVRYLGTIRLRIEELSPTVADAARSARSLGAVLSLFQSIQQIQTSAETGIALKQTVSSLKIEQAKDRTVLTANIPLELLREIATPDKQQAPGPASASQ